MDRNRDQGREPNARGQATSVTEIAALSESSSRLEEVAVAEVQGASIVAGKFDLASRLEFESSLRLLSAWQDARGAQPLPSFAKLLATAGPWIESNCWAWSRQGSEFKCILCGPGTGAAYRPSPNSRFFGALSRPERETGPFFDHIARAIDSGLIVHQSGILYSEKRTAAWFGEQLYLPLSGDVQHHNFTIASIVNDYTIFGSLAAHAIENSPNEIFTLSPRDI